MDDTQAPDSAIGGEDGDDKRVAAGIAQVVSALEEGRADDAIAATRALLDEFPNHPDPTHMLGVLLLKGGRPDQAAEALRRSIAIDAGYPGAHFNLGLALVALGRREEALEPFQQAVALNPAHEGALKGIAKIHEAAGRFQVAEEAWSAVLGVAANDLVALSGVARCQLAAGREGEALAALDAGLAAHPGSPDLQVLKARALEATDGPASALAWLQQVDAPAEGPLSRERDRLLAVIEGSH